jgi:hypothetical protein
MRKLLPLIPAALLTAAGLFGVPTLAAGAPLPDNCSKVQGTVTCFDGPGENQAGVGTYDQGQGNPENTSPEPQDLTCTVNPSKSQGAPNACL